MGRQIRIFVENVLLIMIKTTFVIYLGYKHLILMYSVSCKTIKTVNNDDKVTIQCDSQINFNLHTFGNQILFSSENYQLDVIS